jgi:hypothetical protein
MGATCYSETSADFQLGWRVVAADTCSASVLKSTISVVQAAEAETLLACVARIVVLLTQVVELMLVTSGRGQGYQFPLL